MNLHKYTSPRKRIVKKCQLQILSLALEYPTLSFTKSMCTFRKPAKYAQHFSKGTAAWGFRTLFFSMKKTELENLMLHTFPIICNIFDVTNNKWVILYMFVKLVYLEKKLFIFQLNNDFYLHKNVWSRATGRQSAPSCHCAVPLTKMAFR